MELYNLKNDMRLICVTARSFPDGILEAFQKLEALLPSCEDRTFFGISAPDRHGIIIYKAAASEIEAGEAEQLGCETYTVKKGMYVTETITDWRKNGEVIGTTFRKLLTDPRLDYTSSCVEWYKSEDEVMCMVKLNDQLVRFIDN